jgi:hypothetical protein
LKILVSAIRCVAFVCSKFCAGKNTMNGGAALAEAAVAQQSFDWSRINAIMIYVIFCSRQIR